MQETIGSSSSKLQSWKKKKPLRHPGAARRAPREGLGGYLTKRTKIFNPVLFVNFLVESKWLLVFVPPPSKSTGKS